MNQFRVSEKLVEMIHRDFQGFHPGYRGVHAAARYYAGYFVGSPEAASLSRAIHFQGGRTPVSIRHSNSVSGNPWGPPNSISLAAKFYLPDGTVTDLVALPLPVFFTSTPEQTLEFLTVMQPVGDTGQPDASKAHAFLEANPGVARAVELAKAMPGFSSFATTRFNALHAFRFVNAAGVATYGRYHWAPIAGEVYERPEVSAARSPHFLFEELEDRLRNKPVGFRLEVELAEADDTLVDPSVPWPSDRRRIVMGQLTVTRTTTNEELGDSEMMHDPTRVVDGIELSADPILAARRGIYEVSLAHRTGGWKGRQGSLERAGCPFLGG